jgi:hypothetical protein
VDDFTSDHDVSDEIWTPSQKYVTESPLENKGSEDDFEN